MEPEPEQTIDQVQLAAYDLGRYIYEIHGWQRGVAVEAFAPGHRRMSPPPKTGLFVESFDEPTTIPSDLRGALNTLAENDRLDGASMLALHDLINVIEEDCNELSHLLQLGRRQDLEEYYRNCSSEWCSAVFVAKQTTQNARTADYVRLGLLIGKFLDWARFHADSSTPIHLTRELFEALSSNTCVADWTELAEIFANFKDASCSDEEIEVDDITKDAITRILLQGEGKFRHRLLRNNKLPLPLVRIDEEQEELTFFRTTIPFSAFDNPPARGGLKVFLVLAQYPNRYVSASSLCKRAGINKQPAALKDYISPFRVVVLAKIDEHTLTEGMKLMGCDPKQLTLAKKAFIVSEGAQSKDKTVYDPRYMLAIPPHLVRVEGKRPHDE